MSVWFVVHDTAVDRRKRQSSGRAICTWEQIGMIAEMSSTRLVLSGSYIYIYTRS